MSEDQTREASPVAAELPPTKSWERRAQALAAVFWPSFLAAAFATMLFFAYVDPQALQLATEIHLGDEDRSVYSVGFFFFWCITLISSGLSMFLMFTRRRRRQQQQKTERDGEHE